MSNKRRHQDTDDLVRKQLANLKRIKHQSYDNNEYYDVEDDLIDDGYSDLLKDYLRTHSPRLK